MRLTLRRVGLAGLVLLGVAGAVRLVRAGDGSIEIVQKATGELEQGRLRLKVFVDLPRTDEEITAMNEQLVGAAGLLCDYTDGLFRIDEIEYVRHPLREKQADIWWFRRADRATAGFGFGKGAQCGQPGVKCVDGVPQACLAMGGPASNPGRASAHLNIYGTSENTCNSNPPVLQDCTQQAETIAHELGHLIFELGDHYPNQRGPGFLDPLWPVGASVSGARELVEPQSGLSFYRSVRTLSAGNFEPQIFKDAIRPAPVPTKPGGDPMYESPAGFAWWTANNSSMQQDSLQVCRSPVFFLDASPEQANPVLWQPTFCRSNADENANGVADDCEPVTLMECSISGAPCLVTADCGAGGDCVAVDGFPLCTTILHANSELSSPGSHELDRFDRTFGEPFTPGPSASRARPGRDLVIQGFLYPALHDEPQLNPDRDFPCHEFDPNDPAGKNCLDICSAELADEGTEDAQFECAFDSITRNSDCPFSSAPTYPATFARAWCDHCAIANSVDCPAFSATCGDGVLDAPTRDAAGNLTSAEQCDTAGDIANPVINPLTGDPLRCDAARTPWPVIPQPVPSPFLVGGLVHCQPNCYFDLSRCTYPFLGDVEDRDGDGFLFLREVREQSTAWAFAEVFDDDGLVNDRADPDLVAEAAFPNGRLNLLAMGPSNHGVFTSFRRMFRYRVTDPADPAGRAWPDPAAAAGHVYHEVWELIIAMDAAELAGENSGADGQAHVVRRFELEFENDYAARTSELLSINGVSCSAVGSLCQGDDRSQWPVVHLGFTTNPGGDPYVGTGPCQLARLAWGGDQLCAIPQPPTGPFGRSGQASTPATVTLRLDLRNLRAFLVEDSVTAAGTSFIGQGDAYKNQGGPLSTYARNGLTVVDGLLHEAPQYGDLRHRLSAATSGVGSGPCAEDLDRCAEFYNLFGFNQRTERWEGSRSGLDLLSRQVLGAPWTTTAYPAIGLPTDPAEVMTRTNMVLQDSEQFVDSDWTTLEKVMCSRWGITLDPEDVPDTGADAEPVRDLVACQPPTILAFPDGIDFNQDTQIIFVLDRSGSMGTEDTTLNELTRSRLDFVKNAARMFLADVEAEIPAPPPGQPRFGPRIGLVWYGDESEVRIPGTGTDSCECPDDADVCTNLDDCPESGTCLKGACLVPLPALSDIECPPPTPGSPPCDRITQEQFAADMSLAFEPQGEDPTPTGWTASGQALLTATEMFNPGRPNPARPGTLIEPTRVIVFLSDGLHNRPKGGHCLGAEFCEVRGEDEQVSECLEGTCGSSGTAPCSFKKHGKKPGCWPTSEADELYQQALANLEDRDIFIFDVPLQNEADAAGASIRVGRTSGEVYDATRPLAEDTVPWFSQASSGLGGRQLALTHLTQGYLQGSVLEGAVVHEISVEQGAKSLTVTISDFDARRDIFDTSFNPSVPSGLMEPGSTAIDHPLDATDPSIDFGPAYATFRIANPTAGIWKFFDFGGGQVGNWPKDHFRFYVTANVESETPRCHVDLSARITDGATPIYVSAQAHFERPVSQGAQYSGTWMGPDMLLRKLKFVRDDRTGMHQATIDPSSLVGRGAYSVNVKCKVEDGALAHPGELPPGAPDPAPDIPIEPIAFRRAVASSFYVQSDEDPPIPGLNGNDQDPAVLEELEDEIEACSLPGFCSIPIGFAPVEPFVGDADGDGIPNEDESDPSVDTDGDGNPDINDADANNNSIPDGEDPDIVDSGGAGPGAGGLTPSAWPMFRRAPGHQGRSAHAGPTLGMIAWQTSLGFGGVRSSPVLDVLDRIYVGSNDNRLYALEPDGEVIWSYLTGGDIDSTPALTDTGLVIFGSDDDKVRALDVEDGTLVWQFDTTLDVDSSPVVFGDRVYVGSDTNKLYALDAATGQELWHYTTGGDIDSSPAVMPDGTIVVGSDDDFVYRLKPDLGLSDSQRLIWKRSLGGLDVESSPMIGPGPDQPIYVGGDSNKLYKLNSATGTITWQYSVLLDVASSPALAPDGSIVFGDDAGKVTALNPDGTLKWSYATSGPVISSPAISSQGHVYVGSDDGYLYALRGEAGLSGTDRLLFKIHLGDDVKSSPALGDGAVYVGSDSGKVYEISAPPPGTPPASNCTEKSHLGTSYWFCRDALSWQSARDNCRVLGYDLATVETVAENAFIDTNAVADSWLGGTDQVNENTWRWASSGTQFWQGDEDGAPVGGAYTNFEAGEPNDFFTQDCLSLASGDGGWMDEGCSNTRDYVCEDVPDVMGWRDQVAVPAATGGSDSTFGCAASGQRGSMGETSALWLMVMGLLATAGRRRRGRVSRG